MPDTIPGNTSSTQPLAVGSSDSSSIDSAGDSDWWRVTLSSGYAYQVAVMGSQDGQGTLADPLLRIYSASGVQLAVDDNTSGVDRDAYVEFQPLAGGTYFIAAEASPGTGIGSYTVSLYRDALASLATAATVAVGGRYTEDLGYRGDAADWVAVSLQAGVEYVFDLVGSAYDGAAAGYTLTDGWLALLDAQGHEISEDDDSGVGVNARIVFTPSVSGTYFLDAEGFDATDFGSYVLLANRTVRGAALGIGSAIDDALSHDGEAHWYPITVQAGHAYLISAGGSGATPLADPLIELLRADGSVYDYDDDSGPGLSAQLGFVPDADGTWLVAVRGSGQAGTGGFSLRVDAAPRLSIGDASVVEGNSGNVSLVFTITLSQATDVDVSVQVDTSDGNATAGSDYIARTATLTIPAGQTGASFSVTVLGDAQAEPVEAVIATLGQASHAVIEDGRGVGLIVDDDMPRPVSDPLLPYEWYLGSGPGVDVLPLWSSYRGQGVRVAVFDQGIDASNPDLQPNLSLALSRNAADLTPGGSPRLAGDDHGSAVAGVIAGAADNGGMVGVAPGATLVSLYSPLLLDAAFPASVANAFSAARGFDVLNNSWGTGNLLLGDTNYAFYDDFAQPAWAAAATALRALADQGRHGLGTIVVQSAGNAFDVGDDTNLHNFQNSRYIITVAATDIDGAVASYSSSGASILVAAPGGDGSDAYAQILTTDRSGAAGYGPGDTAAVSGTSFSSPIVAGVVALMLQANPGLGWRDVQEILARSARRIDTAGNDWESNGAHDVNGGGMPFDAVQHDLGFGLVDALAAVRLAETWRSVPRTSANLVEHSVTHAVHEAIPDDGLNRGAGAAKDTIHITQDLRVERAEVTLDVTHPWVGDLVVELTSPSGTHSVLISRPSSGALSAFGSSQSDIHFTLDTVLDWGEGALGDWTLRVFDAEAGLSGSFDGWTLTLTGQAPSDDDVYTYTDAFATLAAEDPRRATLGDSAGVDVIDAAAVTASVRLDLSGASASRIGSQVLTLAPGTQIERAIGGDGDDVLIGNAADNLLHGGRGSDTIDGGDGFDVASYLGPTPVDADLQRGTALQGADVDQLVHIEALFGSSAGDTLRGLAGDERQRGEVFRGGGGDDTIDGRSGVDTAEYAGPRANYTLVRASATSPDITVTDQVGGDGTDHTTSIERFVFADQLVGFGTRAEEVARVAFVLWTPAIIDQPVLFSRGLSYYDVGYDFATLCAAALQFFPEQGLVFAQKLVSDMPGTARTVDGLMALMAAAGGGDAGRAAAVEAMARDDNTTQWLTVQGVFLHGVVADLTIPDFGTLFSALAGP